MTDGDIQALYLSAEQRWMQGWVAGPTLEGNPLRRGDKAPDVEVVDAEGNAIWLASAWAQQPALVLIPRVSCSHDRVLSTSSCGRVVGRHPAAAPTGRGA